jgi:hypothetical protein
MPEFLWRAQVVHAHKDGQPKDAFVNTFHFLDDSDADMTAARAEVVAELVRDFYLTPGTGDTIEPMDLFGNQVAATGHQVRMYPIVIETGDDKRGLGMPPLWVETFDHLGRVVAATSLPSELAACLSYRNNSSGAVPPARRRGRIYFGPLKADESQVEAGTGRAFIGAGARNILLNAGRKLRTQSGVIGAPWVVYSRPFAGRGEIVRPGRTTLPALPARDGARYIVEELWIDDAFDVQRRRGEKFVTRTYST